jgi:hypothetical protein
MKSIIKEGGLCQAMVSKISGRNHSKPQLAAEPYNSLIFTPIPGYIAILRDFRQRRPEAGLRKQRRRPVFHAQENFRHRMWRFLFFIDGRIHFGQFPMIAR